MTKDNSEQRTTQLVTTNIETNIKLILNEFHHSEDVKRRYFTFQGSHGVAVFVETLVNEERLSKSFLERLNLNQYESAEIQRVISSSAIEVDKNVTAIVNNMLKGYVTIFMEGQIEAISFYVSDSFERAIEEPGNEKVIRGAHDGFVEDLSSNIQLIRKRISNSKLVVKYQSVGDESGTEVAIVYLDHIANPKVVQELETRIKSISADMAFSPGFIEEFIEDKPFSPFPQLLITERPDRTKANIMEGRVALLTAGSPTALILPVSFFAFYQSPDDYSGRFYAGSFYRLIRLIGFFIAVFVPALYIATVSFHFEIIPADLVLQVKNSVERVPYPPIIEALLMELTIELIREAGIRLPTPIGQTIGIVGGLVIGDAVVQAGLVSNIMIIVVAITAIASFVVPSPEMNASIRMLRFPFMFAAASFGYLGISFCFILLIMHFCKLESFGSPYFAPVSPLQPSDWRDTFIRMPNWKMSKRPKAVQAQKATRQQQNREWAKDDSTK
ncbi:spore germination protein [Evansella cellulosilytica]|uniref:GerA spore germination protein n=1 Tax=Evansella cellulosilytica (strain ATCC 21833 / DSM 2522 / FERM P-1141 / JCM 9156 / N-4) TaxID=649639 RepID=E6TQG8_EVAC2|nr:spore germination protein [Evansella cellulosilytica]ADU29346.1 GerA spore germination protein [Evansella cellulosilytica DSM 2522]